MYINDLPDQLRTALRDHGADISDLDPIRLVADDVVCLLKDTQRLQVALRICHEWAQINRLTWNPTKPQILAIHPVPEPRPEANLGGVALQWAEEVEYLGLRLKKHGL